MKAENIGAVPVCESMLNTRVVGIVTDRDLALEVVAEGRDADHTRVRDVMTTGLRICYPDDDVKEALNAMEERQIRRVPVVDLADSLVGIIAQADIATRAPELGKTAELVEKVSEPRAGV